MESISFKRKVEKSTRKTANNKKMESKSSFTG